LIGLRSLLGPILTEPRDAYLVAKMGLECQPLLVFLFVVAGGPLRQAFTHPHGIPPALRALDSIEQLTARLL
jgi:hypothetical protein